MQFDFSAHFLKVQPPETTFSGAWESLCADLLANEYGQGEFDRLAAPDLGIDILSRSLGQAYQCKSSIHGSFGSIPPGESVHSLARAAEYRATFAWHQYLFASNAPYTGTAMEKILAEGQRLGLAGNTVVFRGPDFWDDLCVKHRSLIQDRFDYRVNANQRLLLEALERAKNGPDRIRVERLMRGFRSGHLNKNFYKASVKNSLTELGIDISLPESFSGADLAILFTAFHRLLLDKAITANPWLEDEAPWLLAKADSVFDLRVTVDGESIWETTASDWGLEDEAGDLEVVVDFRFKGRSLRDASAEEETELKTKIQACIWEAAHNLVELETASEAA